MIEIEYTGDDIAGEMRAAEKRASDLSGANAGVQRLLIEQNAGINFDPIHRDSVLEMRRDEWRIGSRKESYGELVEIDDDEVAEALLSYIETGEI